MSKQVDLGRTGTFPRHIQARSKFSARERKKGARDKRREQKRLSGIAKWLWNQSGSMIKLLGKFCGDERNNDSELSNWFYFLTLFRKLKCGKVHRIFFFWDEQNIANFKTDFKRVCLNKLRCLKGELWQYHICLSLWYLETHDQAWIWYVRVSLRVFSLIWSSLDQGRLSSLQLCTLCLLISHVCIASRVVNLVSWASWAIWASWADELSSGFLDQVQLSSAKFFIGQAQLSSTKNFQIYNSDCKLIALDEQARTCIKNCWLFLPYCR